MNDHNSGWNPPRAQYPWKQGDELFADELNAAIAAASSGVAAGGPFLPLTGGSISPGPLNIVNGNTLTLRTSPTTTQISYNVPNLVYEASTFAGTIVGNVLTITGGFLGTINVGDSVYWNGGSATGKIISGSGTVWTLDAAYPPPITGGASFTGSINGTLLTVTGPITGSIGIGDIVFWSGGSDTIVGPDALVPNAWDLYNDNGIVPSQAMTTTTHMSSNNKESVTQFDALSTSIGGTIPKAGINNTAIVGIRLGSSLDNLNLPSGPGLDFLDINSSTTGSNFNGTRYGIRSNVVLSDPCTLTSRGHVIGGFYIVARGRGTTGGTSGRGNGMGNVVGGVLTATLGANAGYWSGVLGQEIDMGVVAPAQPEAVVGMQIVHQAGHSQQGVYADIGFGLGDQGQVSKGWRVGVSVGGPNSQWPIDPNGIIWRSSYAPSTPWANGVPGAQAAGGFDLAQVDFTGVSDVGGGFAFRVDGAKIIPALGNPGGTFEAGAGEFSGTSTGAKIDTTFSQMTGTPAVVAGGSLWGVDDTLNDAYGNLLQVATLSGDAIATVTVLRRGWQKTPPSNPVPFTIATAKAPKRVGTGATFNLTWTLNNTLALQPSGGTTTFGGPTAISGAYSASSTSPFLYSHINVFGTVPAGTTANWYAFNINSDTADASTAQGHGATGSYFGHNISAGSKGGRTTFNAFLNQTGATTTTASDYYVALGATAQAGYSAGGTSGSPAGALFASNMIAMLNAGATNWIGVHGLEIDVGAVAGTAPAYKGGLSIVQLASDAARGSVADRAIEINNQRNGTAPGWAIGIAFGGLTGWWPFTNTSTLIGTQPVAGGGPAVAALAGIDWTAITFSGNAFASPGFTVNGTGVVTAAGGTLNGGLHLGSATAPGGVATDVSRHIELYGGGYAGFSVTSNQLNYVIAATGAHEFFVGTTMMATLNGAGFYMNVGSLGIGGGAGPTWTTGSAAPAATAPVGSLYSRVGGAVGSTLYVSRGAGTWNAVAGV